MKKNFFKKLSFVLALAMIVSVIAPAAGAFAADALKLNSTKKYLHLSGISGANDYNFNILGTKQKGWTYEWSSADEDVATVDEKNGVTTATGAGTTKVTVVITDKDGEEVGKPLSATVVVRDNIETVTISNAPTTALAVGQEHDFNRTYVTEAGLTAGSTSVTRWALAADAKATITDAGLFKATEAGEYKVTALSFQSKEKFDSWKVSGDAALVLDTDEVTVTVAAGIVATKQVDTIKFTVEFDSNMSKTDLSATTAKVYQVINGKQVSTGTEKIKSLTLDTTGKIATVELYTSFNSKVVYNFVYGDLVGVFTAASTDIKDVAGIVFDDFTANVDGTAVDMNKKVSAVNAAGVVILKAETSLELRNALSFKYDGDLSKGYVATNNAYIYSKGYAAPITATFSTYVYNETTKVYDKVEFKDGAIATGVETDGNLNAASLQFLIKKGAAPANDTAGWATSGFTLAAKDTAYYISTRFKANSANADTAYTIDDNGVDASDDKFIYVSTNEDKLIINGDYVYPIADGVVTVLVKDADQDNDPVVGTFDLTIQSARAFASAAIDNPSITVGNGAFGADGSATAATITVKDSMGAALDVATDVDIKNWPSNRVEADAPVVTAVDQNGDNDGKVFVSVDANGPAVKDGIYYYQIKLTGLSSDKFVYVTVVVTDGATDVTPVTWRLELDTTSVDLKKAAEAKDINIDVFGYNSKGVKVAQLNIADYAIEITKGGSDIQDDYTYDDESVEVIWGTSPAALSFLPTDTYVVTAKAVGTNPTGRVDGAVIGTAIFTVSNTTTKSFVVDKPVVDTAATVKDLVKTAISLYLNGDKVSDANEANIVSITYNDGQTTYTNDLGGTTITSGKSIHVTSVKYRVLNTDKNTQTEYTFDLGVTIKVK